MAESPLRKLAELGQSIWLDYISRELVTTDELQRLIDGHGISGMTSNPTIFEKAIGHGDAYDGQLRKLVDAGVRDPDEMFFELAISDIQRAADTLRPVYDRTGGGDGFVSIEVAPNVAHDTRATVGMAKDLWQRIERPNLMVKVPATPEGIPAIEELIAAGVNINVTLIFALTAYEAVAEAYIRGLERRRRRHEPVDRVHSVASFFVSRVDTAADKLIEEKLERRRDDPALEGLLGKAAIANAVLAYEKFEEIFRGDRFSALREAGAHPQRPLWASTSAKNPKYRDVLYAEALIGPDTVDTMPPETIEAFADHGVADRVTVNSDYPGAHDVMKRLKAAGIDMDEVTQKLLDAGVKNFAASYDSLIRTIAEKIDRFTGGLGEQQRLDLGEATDALRERIGSPESRELVERIWKRDPGVWKAGDRDHAKVIRNRLGWLDVVASMRKQVPQLRRFAESASRDGINDAVLLGMGGSSLCPEVLRTSFPSTPGFPRLHVLDTTDPAAIRHVAEAIEPERTLFIVSSKSGGTIETLSHLAFFWDLLESAGVRNVGRHFAAVTDAGTSLARDAQARKFRHVFENPADIGGRYSALSYFGLVPAAVCGIDVDRLLDRATAMLRQCSAETYPLVNSGLVLGTVMAAMHDQGRDKVTILAPPRIAAFSLWAEQLIAESTGKEGKGLVPVGSEPIGEPDSYGDDRLFVVLGLGGDAGFDVRVDALRRAGQPVLTLLMRDEYDLAAEFVRWEFATAVAGAHLRIDPFDEPNVAESKENTRSILEIVESKGRLPADGEPTASGDGMTVYGGGRASSESEALVEHLSTLKPHDYVALMAYVEPSETNQAALQGLRTAIRDAHRVATTLGFGPRFLHSTGQLHKGGPNTGVFVQITVDDDVDAEVPGQPFTFSTLKRAQAAGDLKSLRSHRRRAIRIHAGDASHLADALRRLTEGVKVPAGAR